MRRSGVLQVSSKETYYIHHHLKEKCWAIRTRNIVLFLSLSVTIDYLSPFHLLPHDRSIFSLRSENGVWVDDKCYLLPPVKIEASEWTVGHDWRITSEDKRYRNAIVISASGYFYYYKRLPIFLFSSLLLSLSPSCDFAGGQECQII